MTNKKDVTEKESLEETGLARRHLLGGSVKVAALAGLVCARQ